VKGPKGIAAPSALGKAGTQAAVTASAISAPWRFQSNRAIEAGTRAPPLVITSPPSALKRSK
jgi:hypothetical protein